MLWLVDVAYRLAYGRSWSLDLRVYRAAGHALYSGGAVYSTWFTPNHLAFTYPPFALLVLSPLSLGPEGVVAACWWAANAAALVAVLYIALTAVSSLRVRRALAVATLLGAVAVLALEPVRSDMDYGQVNVLLMLLVVSDTLYLRGRGRGVLVGLAAALKLTPLIYLAYFLVRGEGRAALRGAVVFVVAGAASWLVLPQASARYWFHQVGTTARIGKVGDAYNQSWAGLLHRSPVPVAAHGTSVVWVLCALVTALAALVVAASRRRAGADLEALFALALAELLVSPISWTHHWSWLALAPLALLRPAAGGSMRVLVALTLLVAVAAPYAWLHGGWLGAAAGDSLTVVGAVLLIGWAVSARPRTWRAGSAALTAA